ncbi:TetR family transcriptional regulator [Actinoplanes sp. NBRC 14428]|uniref:TetR family transcriptional regulator n=1 Tax=Pseudosporangium ferrugineum TaxID=439699 RepID=A0A2T0SIM8_9ACTN|nr:TetR family transcriptional regulator [Pseudosporangium ferrugineum]PRY33262.1 TetR family transcriptional regulator [Pseudosporangium ferrugineum]BCJ48741.1 TetR family transcriptional regulator [Actinoplanes sp. NBRC 14428]
MTSPGLRERKKARTRAAIREHALRLFEAQGYAATTVDQIAEAADVSPSTFFRYYPTKEDLVLTDDYDPLLLEAVRGQPAGLHPIEAIRRSIRQVYTAIPPQEWAAEQRRQRILQSVDDLRARYLRQYSEAIAMLATVVAERAGLPPEDFRARVLAGAVMGAALASLPGSGPYETRDFEVLDRALDLLQAGLPLTGEEQAPPEQD